jgi:hypothetical protein
MKTTHRLAMFLILFGIVIGNPRLTAFQAVDSIASVENILYINLKEVINKGVDLITAVILLDVIACFGREHFGRYVRCSPIGLG